MKFYIASRFYNKEEVKEIHNLLVLKGHEYTSTWVDFKNIKPYSEHKLESRDFSIDCFNNIKKSDIFILLTNDTGKAMYIELGIALSLSIEKDKPRIYAIGKFNKDSMFYYHPQIKQVDTIEDVFNDIGI